MMVKSTRLMALLIAFCLGIGSLSAQTVPAAYDLSASNYSFSTWDTTSAAGTFPASMVFQIAPVIDNTLNYTPYTTDWLGAYNLKNGSRVTGLVSRGIYFAQSTSGSFGKTGAAILAINTTGRTNVNVSFVAGQEVTGVFRTYALRLQYRIGTTGDFADVLTPLNAPIEYYYTAASAIGTEQTFSVTLPSALNDQPVVQLRWLYYQAAGVTTGGRPNLRLDDISVTSVSSAGAPTKLDSNAISPNNAKQIVNIPFDLTIASVDNAGIAKNVLSNTAVRLELVSGTGVLSGTLTGSIDTTFNSTKFSGLSYNVAETITLRAVRTAGDVLLNSRDFTINFSANTPSKINVINFYGKGTVNTKLEKFTAQILNSDDAINAEYTNYMLTVNKVSGPGNIAGTFEKATNGGVTLFDNVMFDQPGTYVINVSAPGLPNSIDYTIDIAPAPTFTELVVPSIIKGFGAFGARMPHYALVEANNLLPNTTYRYYVNADTTNLGSGGAGNTIHVNWNTEEMSYSSSVTLTGNGGYSTFTTGAEETSKKLWIALVPTTNARFNTEGKNLYWRITFGNEFGSLISRWGSVASAKNVNFGSTTNRATGIYDYNSWLAPKHILVFSDENNNAIASSAVQDDGTTLLTPGFDHQSTLWFAHADSTNAAWATQIPNELPGGIRKIEEYDIHGNLVNTWTDADGVWAGVDTRNATGGTSNPIAFEIPQLKLLSPMATEELCNDKEYRIAWASHGVSLVDIQVSSDGINYETIASKVDARQGYYDWDIPRHVFSNKPIWVKIVSVEHNYISSGNDQVRIWDTPIIIAQTESSVNCKGNDKMITVVADGSDLTYQWFRDGEVIADATTNYIDFKNMQYDVSAEYSCLVTGHAQCPTAISNVIELYIATVTQVTKQPVDQLLIPGAKAVFEIQAHIEGRKPDGKVMVQWYRDGVALTDNDRYCGTNSTYMTIVGVRAADVSDNYYAVFNGLCQDAAVETRRASIKLADFNFTANPTDKTVCADETAEFTATATSTMTGTVTYQWYKDGAMLSDGARIAGAQTNKLVIDFANINDAGKYYVVAALEGTSLLITSDEASLTVNTKPVITTQPEANIPVQAGRDIEINVVATSATPMTYQWYKDGTALTNGTYPTLEILGATATEAGKYWVVVTNGCGDVSSDTTYVTVTVKTVLGIEDEVLPGMYFMTEAMPNPANGISVISVVAPKAENASISIINANGTKVANLFDGVTNIGRNDYTINVNELNLVSGTYFIVFESGKTRLVKPLTVVK